MIKRMIVHDRRATGAKVPPVAQNTYEPDDKTPFSHAVGWVRDYARSQGKLDQLVIICHGYVADWDIHDQVCTGIPFGGFGLQLCKEGLGMSNVASVRAWDGLIGSIIVFACSAAETGPGNSGTSGDGGWLMMNLAHWSGAEVIASSTTQGGSWENGGWVWDFSRWQGPVWRFDPATNTQDIIAVGGVCL